jgi:hypothetical protein
MDVNELLKQLGENAAASRPRVGAVQKSGLTKEEQLAKAFEARQKAYEEEMNRLQEGGMNLKGEEQWRIRMRRIGRR